MPTGVKLEQDMVLKRAALPKPERADALSGQLPLRASRHWTKASNERLPTKRNEALVTGLLILKDTWKPQMIESSDTLGLMQLGNVTSH